MFYFDFKYDAGDVMKITVTIQNVDNTTHAIFSITEYTQLIQVLFLESPGKYRWLI
jgi:hypothetical protein